MLSSRGGRLRLVLPGPETHTRKILQLFGIQRIFEVHDSVDDALADLRAAVLGEPAPAAAAAGADAADAVPRPREGNRAVAD